MILLFSECFYYSLDVLLLFDCCLCLTSSAHQHNILLDKSRAGLAVAGTQAQSHGDLHGIGDDVRRIVRLSCIDSVPFSGTCDRDCEHCLEVTC
jgi:hypothetical protein